MTQIESAIERMEFTIFAHSSEHLPTDTNITALLVGVRHLCDEQGLDFYKLSDRSYEQYLIERDRARKEGV